MADMTDKEIKQLILETVIEIAKQANRDRIEVPYNDYAEAARKLLKKYDLQDKN